MMTSSEEATKLSDDFQTEPQQLSLESDKDGIDIDNAIEMAGGGCGLVFYSAGPFLLFCLLGAETLVLSIIALILRCEWNLSTISVAALQVCLGEFVFHLSYTILPKGAFVFRRQRASIKLTSTAIFLTVRREMAFQTQVLKEFWAAPIGASN